MAASPPTNDNVKFVRIAAAVLLGGVAAEEFLSAALARGVPTVEVNPEVTPFTADALYFLQGSAGKVLPALLKAAWPV